ncbi:MAG: hypothetical protein KatS3mg110_1830 [Pirellulaceae bacterium]|nr:MAG: hypothetical protein KatS3mg110_1830 [Pirellulaceae bacterium]
MMRRISTGRRFFACAVFFSALSALLGFVASGVPARAQAAGQENKQELKIPERQILTLVTRDGVSLYVEYYPGGFYAAPDGVKKLDPKTVVPLILVHGWNGRGADFSEFAKGLQQYGYAVAVPDLRGHGRSTVMRTAAGVINLDPGQMNNREINALLTGMIEDIDTVKGYLLSENNKGQLNIELLGVVGAEVGALVALNWAVYDWNKQSLPAFKQGKDVKALALLSPIENFRGMNNRAALAHPIVSRQIPMLIAVGTGNREMQQDAEKLYRFLEKRHAVPEETLRYVPVDVSLQGTQLLQRGTPVAAEVLRFFYKQLNEKSRQWPWMDRTLPLDQ